MVGNGVEELDRLAVTTGRRHLLAQRLRHQAAVVHVDVDDLGLVRGEGVERSDVGRRFRHDDVTRVAEDSSHEVESLLGPAGDGDVVGVSDETFDGHDLADVLADLRLALARSVLHDDGTAGVDELLQRLTDDVEGKIGDVRHATGQRDDFGTVRHREESPNRGGLQTESADGVAIMELVEGGIDATACDGLGGFGSSSGSGIDAHVVGRRDRLPDDVVCAAHPPTVPHQCLGNLE